ncbi:MAG TPA: PAS domain-containing protein [Azospirillaceae bacterium]|nr:PAS domain-containing protein [Azospirillaceae bacterium]
MPDATTSNLSDFRPLFEVLSTPTAVFAPDLKIVAVNDAYLRISMMRREDIIGRHVQEVFPHDPGDPAATDRQTLAASLAEVLARRRTEVLETQRYALRRPLDEGGQREERYWRVVNTPVAGGSGEVAWILHEVEDVTELTRAILARRHAEEALAAATAGRRAVLDSIGEGFIIMDRDFRIVEINQAGIQIDGRTAAAILGRPFWEVWPATAGTQVEANYRRAMCDRVPVSFEFNYADRSRDTWLDVRAYPTDEGLAVLYRDVTDRKQSEQRLRENEARLRLEREFLDTLIRRAPVGISITEAPSGRALSINDKAIELLGRGGLGDDMAPYRRSGALHPDGKPYAAEDDPTARTLLRGEVVDRELMIYPRDGASGTEMRRLEVSSAPVRDSTGNIVAAVTVYMDVEGRHRRAEQLQALAAASLAATAAPTLDAKLNEIAKAAKEIMGAHHALVSLTFGPYWSQSVIAVAPPEAHAWLRDRADTDRTGIYARVCRANRPLRLTQAELKVHRRGDADEHPPLRGCLLVPLVARDGRNLGLVQLCDKLDGDDFDADDEAMLVQLAQLASAAVEQAQAEQKLRESEDHFRHTVELNPQIPWTTDADGGPLDISDRWLALTGFTRERALREGWVPVAHPEDLPKKAAAWGRSVVTGEPYDIEHRIRLADGSYRWMRSRAFPRRDQDGKIIRWYGTTEDIHDRKLAEERQALLAREVDHRAKNVLAVVQAVVRLTSAENPADFVDAVEGRVAALARAHGLLARGGWSGADLRALAEEELAPYLDTEDKSRAILHGPPVTLGPGAVQPMAMVLHELATNAAKHGALSAPGGRINVTWGREVGGGLRLDWREVGGPPITGPPTRRGFGSDMLRGATAQLGGKVTVDWAPEGLRCVLTVAAGHLTTEECASAPHARHAPRTIAGRLEGRRVLVAEDDALLALAMRQALEGLGCSVVGPATSLGETLRLAADERDLDAAVLDVNLCGVEVWPAADLLAARGVPHMFTTGYDLGLSGGNRIVLEKPFALAQLKAELRHLLGTAKPPPTALPAAT